MMLLATPVLARGTADDLVVQTAVPHKGTGPIMVCAAALNIGTKTVRRVQLRWDFKLRSRTVSTFRDWQVSLAPSTVPQERWFYALAEHGGEPTTKLWDRSRKTRG